MFTPVVAMPAAARTPVEVMSAAVFTPVVNVLVTVFTPAVTMSAIDLSLQFVILQILHVHSTDNFGTQVRCIEHKHGFFIL
jgi:hypothetical protein